jgi:hypothetical protein
MSASLRLRIVRRNRKEKDNKISGGEEKLR